MTNENVGPDYSYWVKFDKWSFREAALLLHGLEPNDYKAIRFNSKSIPEDANLKEAHKTYLILTKADGFRYAQAAQPIEVFRVAAKKGLSLPDQLVESYNAQYERENQFMENARRVNEPDIPETQEFSTRERNSCKKLIGLLADIICDFSNRFKLNGHPNALQISQRVLQKAEDRGIDTTGLKSCNRKITEAWEYLLEESVPERDG